MSAHFSTAYLPPLAWFRQALRQNTIYLEKFESWQKQSYRNRCYIYGPHGPQMLNIPILHNDKKNFIGTLEISYHENWQHTHWQAIKTAYGSSPFFEILGPELEEFYQQSFDRLFDWNLALIRLMMNWLQAEVPIIPTSQWEAEVENDLREAFHPKRQTREIFTPYPQVFAQSQGFEANLSIIDLLFNEGPAAYDYLKN